MNRMTVIVVTALFGVVGCASQSGFDHEAVFREQYSAALAHPSAEMRVSALKAIQAPSDESAMRLRGAVLYQAATGQPKRFAAEGAEALTALENARLHEMPQELQVLAYLAARVNRRPELAEKLAAREIREAVDAGCSYPTPLAYATLSPEPAKSFKKLAEFNMASACMAALHGRDTEALTNLVSVAAIVRSTGLYTNELVDAGVDSSPATAVRFFLNRLRKQRGLNFDAYTR